MAIERLFDLPIHALTMGQVVCEVERSIDAKSPLLIGVVNAAKIVNMRRNSELDRAVRSADMILADGISVVWASRILRRRLPERVAGIDLMSEMLELASKRKFRVFFFGAREEVVAKVVEHTEENYPGAVIAGYRNGYYDAGDEERIADQIRESGADMLFVAMSPPKKEIFMAEWFKKMEVPAVHGVGGAFDVVAGRTKRAPEFWQKAGLEWLYRIVQEPGRMWRRYLVTNTLFVWLLGWELLGKLRPSRS